MRATRLKRVADVRYGLGQPPPIAVDGIPILRATNIERGRIRKGEMIFARLEDLPLDRAPLLKAGEVLVVRSGAYTGDSALVTAEWEGSAPGYDLRLTPRLIDPRFLAYQMLSSAVLEQIALAKVRAAQPHLNADDLGDIEIVTGPLGQERAIADYLDAETQKIDAVVAARRKQLAALSDHRRALIDGLTVPIALGGSADGPDPWRVVALKRAAAFFSDGDWIETPFITSEGIRLIQTGNIGEGEYRDQGFRYITEETFRALGCTEVLPGDILISRLAGTVGFACLAPNLGTRMVVAVDVVIMRPVPALDPAFAVAYLSSSRHLALAELLARGTTMQRLSRSQVGEMTIPVPPLDVQRQIVAEIEVQLADLRALSAALDQQVDLLLKRRQAIITAATAGKLDLQGAAA